MNPDIFKDALKQAEAELDQVLAEEATIEERRIELERRAAKLTENIGHLAALADDSDFKKQVAQIGFEGGMTNAILTVLRAADIPLAVSEIKERIEPHGFTNEKYQNLLATLHIALDRLSKDSDSPIEKLRDERGKKVYRTNPNYSSFKLALNRTRIRELLTQTSGADTPLPLRVKPKHPTYGGTMTEPPPLPLRNKGLTRALKFPSPEKKED
jgi:hypothetical protein